MKKLKSMIRKNFNIEISNEKRGKLSGRCKCCKRGATWQATIWAAGVLQAPITLNRSAPYYGELPYAGRRIEAGFNSVPKN